MSFTRWYAGPAAAFALVACSSVGQSKQATMSPAAQQASQAQSRSQQALSRASEAQKKAADQADKARKAQEDVQHAQQQLTQAQRTAEQEQQKAQQLQQEANQATQQATATAQQSQQQASRALAQEGQQVSRGEQTITGKLQEVQPGEISVLPSGGHSMTLQVGAQTTVRIDGQEASLSDLTQGEDARVAYQLTGPTPTALSIDVRRNGGAGQGSPPAQQPQGSTGTGSTSSPGSSNGQ